MALFLGHDLFAKSAKKNQIENVIWKCCLPNGSHFVPQPLCVKCSINDRYGFILLPSCMSSLPKQVSKAWISNYTPSILWDAITNTCFWHTIPHSPIRTHASFPSSSSVLHDDVIKWKQFLRYWPFVRGIHRSRWIPRTKASAAELWCFLWSAPE